MSTITFKPSYKTIDVPAGTDLIAATKIAGLEVDSPCGGKGTCGKCAVLVQSGNVDTKEYGPLTKDQILKGMVLACTSTLNDTPVVIELPQRHGYAGGQFTDDRAAHQLIDTTRFPELTDFTTRAFQILCTVPAPRAGDGLGDLDRLIRAIKNAGVTQTVVTPLPVIRIVAEKLREKNGAVCCTLIHRNNEVVLADLTAGTLKQDLFGAAIDIGTTTVAVHLVRLFDGEIVATQTEYNGQILCGLDVISRINYAKRNNGLHELATRVKDTINQLITLTAERSKVARNQICAIALSGNTTMIHLLIELNPEYIRLDPYTPTILATPPEITADAWLHCNPYSSVFISPAVGSYVGGDITAGLLCTNLMNNDEQLKLLIDIGTNGELVIGNNDFVITCACSAGPAFEGGGIEHGMRAAAGAIDTVAIDAATGTCTYGTIGNVPAQGICGSGMISLIAGLFRLGFVDQSGKIRRNRPCDNIILDGRKAYYLIVPAAKSDSGKSIYISENDIENIIRTKASIFSACSLMLAHIGMNVDDLSAIFIAGGFGRFLNFEDAVTIGMIPDLPKTRFHYIGNASLAGSYMLLLSDKHRAVQKELSNRMTYIDLSSEPAYMDHYTGALFLPHTNAALFPSVKTAR